MTEALTIITYASILLREKVRIALVIATFNDLEVNVGHL